MLSTTGTRLTAKDAEKDDDQDVEYPLPWPRSQRWKPRYNVPRNSLEEPHSPHAKTASSEVKLDSEQAERDVSLEQLPISPLPHSTSFGRTRRDIDTRWVADALAAAAADKQSHHGDEAEEELSNLSHWLETLAELYMNELDNRARFDPRWLNITRRERYEGLQSVTITILDYMNNNSVQCSEAITGSKNRLASALQRRPSDAAVRVILVSDVSRFVMGTLGQLYNVDPEFWFDHLVSSGYSGSDSGLKLKNAVWMNWAGRETHFRHRALPGPGQRTAWNAPWRTRGRQWAHLRWGRLGLLNYLGRKGFHQDEIEGRLKEGRWVTERDIYLDKRGLLLTEKRLARLDKKRKKAEKKGDKNSNQFKAVSSRTKTSNVYRAYSTFDGLPRNPSYWSNRDLRVMAPEAASYWSGKDEEGRDTVIILTDSLRSMKNHSTKEVTPSLTFMPRPLELESYTDEEWWRTADPDETYLDPPPVLPTKEELKAQRKAALKDKMQKKATQIQGRLKPDLERDASSKPEVVVTEDNLDGADVDDEDSDLSGLSSDSEYDLDDEKDMRKDYANASSIVRDRDFARKYALNTHDLLSRHLKDLTAMDFLQQHGDDATGEVMMAPSPLQSLLVKLVLDDMHELATELRLELDHLDSGLADGDALLQLLEASGNTTRQNLHWLRATLLELREWTAHLTALVQQKRSGSPEPSGRPEPGKNAGQGRAARSLPVLELSDELTADLEVLASNLTVLQRRADASLSLLSSSTGLQQSSLVIDQTAGINKLTELAFFFIPVSFITAVFSMQVRELTGPTPPEFWTWGVALVGTLLTTYFIRATIRSPSMRVAALHCRATILNRFTSSRPGSSSRRLNTIGNRAIVKFAIFTVGVLGFAALLLLIFILTLLLLLGGIWLSAAAVAIYYIVTRWGEPAVLVPCFISLPLAGAGLWVSWLWVDEMTDVASKWAQGSLLWFRDHVLPNKYVLDKVDDQDLAKEGVNTYARQAIVMST